MQPIPSNRSMVTSHYWNHNTAYHPWIIRHVEQIHDPVALDVGAGEGLLAEKLASICDQVIGVEPDPAAASKARERLKTVPNAHIVEAKFDGLDLEPESVDVITFVASLHHMDPEVAFAKAVGLLRSGGKLLVVGLTANRTLADWCYSATVLPAVRARSWFHQETADIGVPTQPSAESLNDIRAIASQVLPGARIRRGLYYRYLLSWSK